VVGLAARGLGVAVLSASMVATDSALHAAAIRDVDIPATLALVWRDAASPAVHRLVEHARLAFRQAPAA
jgi:DNA-binding transcriptional LysR family regulator